MQAVPPGRAPAIDVPQEDSKQVMAGTVLQKAVQAGNCTEKELYREGTASTSHKTNFGR